MAGKNLTRLLLAFAAIASALQVQAPPAVQAEGAGGTFVENRGQWDAQGLFLARTPGLDLWVTGDGLVFDYKTYVQSGFLPRRPGRAQREGFIKGHVIRMTLVGAQPSAVTGKAEQPGAYNYFVGDDSQRWATGARAFGEVVAEQPYAGVSLRYSIEDGGPRYDFLVKPGADLSQIGLKVEGADGLSVQPDGNLAIQTSLGPIVERGLAAYQDTPSGRARIACRFLLDGNILRFDVGSYDRSLALVIDPIVASSYFGSSSLGDSCYSVATDKTNNIYLVGNTTAANYPTTTGAYQRQNKDRSFLGTAFVTKISANEKTLIYSTYLGGSGGDFANAITVDALGSAYVGGSTGSKDFPITKGAFQIANKENTANSQTAGFVTKLNPAGSALVYSTYLSGSGSGRAYYGEEVYGLAVDKAGDLFAAGITNSLNFPVTRGTLQTVNKQGKSSSGVGFVTKLNPAGTALVYSTFLGGTGHLSYGVSEGDSARAITVDSYGQATVAGWTGSKDFPVSKGAIQSTNRAYGNTTFTQDNAFVLRLNASGSALVYGTYLGGTTGDSAAAVAIDSAGDAFVAGDASSTDFPVTYGALLIANPEANSSSNGIDAPGEASFVAKIDPTGKKLLYSTYLGGSGGIDRVAGLALDSLGQATLAGYTDSRDFPLTPNALRTTDGNSNGTGFVSVVSPAGNALLYSSFLGGSGSGSQMGSGDSCVGVVRNVLGQTVVAGTTDSSDFPTTSGAYQASPRSMFIATLAGLSLPLPNLTLLPASVIGGSASQGTITLAAKAAAATTFKLSSTSALAGVPAVASVPAGSSAVSFPIVAKTVSADSTCTIKAVHGTTTLSAQLFVLCPIQTFQLDAQVYGGFNALGMIKLIQAGGPYTTKITSPSADLTMPQAEIGYGGAFENVAIPSKPVTKNTVTTVTASVSGNSKTVTLTIVASPASYTVTPASIAGGGTATGTVHLPAKAGSAGVLVLINSNVPEATVPSSITVPAGHDSATFTITTKAVGAKIVANIAVVFTGAAASRTLTITPP